MENHNKLITEVVITDQPPVSSQIYIPIILNSLIPCNENLTFCVELTAKERKPWLSALIFLLFRVFLGPPCIWLLEDSICSQFLTSWFVALSYQDKRKLMVSCLLSSSIISKWQDDKESRISTNNSHSNERNSNSSAE